MKIKNIKFNVMISLLGLIQFLTSSFLSSLRYYLHNDQYIDYDLINDLLKLEITIAVFIILAGIVTIYVYKNKSIKNMIVLLIFSLISLLVIYLLINKNYVYQLIDPKLYIIPGLIYYLILIIETKILSLPNRVDERL